MISEDYTIDYFDNWRETPSKQQLRFAHKNRGLLLRVIHAGEYTHRTQCNVRRQLPPDMPSLPVLHHLFVHHLLRRIQWSISQCHLFRMAYAIPL